VRIGLGKIFVDERDQARAFYTPVLGSQVLIGCLPRPIEYAQVMDIDGRRVRLVRLRDARLRHAPTPARGARRARHRHRVVRTTRCVVGGGPARRGWR
jgi:hypothetical protein